METEKYQDISLKLAPLLNALAHPARVQIILHLAKYNGCQTGSISDNLPLAKSTVSEHLSKLREAGLIKSLSDGHCIYYAIDDEKFESVKCLFHEFISAISQTQDSRKECCAEPAQEKIKCTRIYEICKTLPCFSVDCFPENT